MSEATTSRVSKTPGVCGGDACIRGTRFPVWGLVESRQQGLTDADILRRHPDLTRADLDAAWDYYARNRPEIEQALWLNEASMVEHDGRGVPAELIDRGRRLGLSDDRIRDAFDPPLAPDVLDARPAPAGGA
jgi:uncharacterized protein (DUF433 family)